MPSIKFFIFRKRLKESLRSPSPPSSMITIAIGINANGAAIFKNIIRPGLASAIMGAATFMVYRVLSNAISSWKLACLLSLAFAVVLYAVLVVFLRCLTYEDCMLLPKGEKIAKILRIRKKN